MEDSFPVLGPSSGQRPPPAVPYSASPTAPLRRDNGPRFTVHETTKQLTDDLTTTSIRQPQLPAVSWIRMPPIRIYCASQPSARMPRARITRATIPRARIPRARIPRAKIPRANMPRTRVHCADQPPHRPRPIAPPASKRPSPTRKKTKQPQSRRIHFQINNLPAQDHQRPVARISVLRSAAFPTPASH